MVLFYQVLAHLVGLVVLVEPLQLRSHGGYHNTGHISSILVVSLILSYFVGSGFGLINLF